MRRSLLSAVLSLSVLLSTLAAAQGASYTFVALFFYVTFFLAFPSWSSAQIQDVTPPNLTASSLTPTAINTSSGPVTYTVTDLGTLPGYNESVARGINATGQVVGALRNSTGEFRAFIWDQTQGMQDIGTLGGNFSEALAVNNNGAVVGASYVAVGSPQRAFLYSNGLMINLGDQSWGAEEINTLGEIVGYGQNGAFIWDSTSGFQFIGGTSASAINDLGQVVGSLQTTNGETHAFLYDAGSLHDLGTLGGGNSDAYDINNLGQVVGRSHTDPAGTFLHAFLYSAGMMIDLGTFPGGVQSTAYAINNLGQVVGDATVPAGTHQAFLYEAGALYNLNDLIPASAGWILERGEDINDAGQIVGFGIVGGERHAVLLTPIPEDSTPPAITVTASPATLSPPNGRLVTVTVSGTMTDSGGSGVQAGSAAYVVMDEYGQIQPSGSVTLGMNGQYTFTVALQASRRGNDPDGRQYLIVVSAKDNAGNLGRASATVTVPRN